MDETPWPVTLQDWEVEAASVAVGSLVGVGVGAALLSCSSTCIPADWAPLRRLFSLSLCSHGPPWWYLHVRQGEPGAAAASDHSTERVEHGAYRRVCLSCLHGNSLYRVCEVQRSASQYSPWCQLRSAFTCSVLGKKDSGRKRFLEWDSASESTIVQQRKGQSVRSGSLHLTCSGTCARIAPLSCFQVGTRLLLFLSFNSNLRIHSAPVLLSGWTPAGPATFSAARPDLATGTPGTRGAACLLCESLPCQRLRLALEVVTTIATNIQVGPAGASTC